MSEVQNKIVALAITESLKNDIDNFVVLDRQIKALTEQADQLKASIKSSYKPGKHRGKLYGVAITEKIRTGSVNIEALCKKFGITDEQLASFRAEPCIYTEVKVTV